MWCPKCKEHNVCAAIPIIPDRFNQRDQRKMAKGGDGDIHWFERNRKCKTCGEEFETVEIEIDFLYELFKLRDTVKKIRDDADALIRWQK